MSARLADLITENGPDRNLDEETMEQQQKIEQEVNCGIFPSTGVANNAVVFVLDRESTSVGRS